jgi:tetratricopeptide (TPR) repeat protein
MLHLFLLIWAILKIKKKNILAFGILYYFITFSIVSNLFFPIGTNMAERFMFMPSVGFSLGFAYLFYKLGVKLSQPNTTSGFSKIYLIIGVVLFFFSALTINRNFDWKDNLTLFSKDIAVSKNSGKIQTSLAGIYIAKATVAKVEKLKEIEELSLNEKQEALKLVEQEKRELLEKSIPLLKKALEIHPTNNVAWLQMANAHHNLGQLESNTPQVNLSYLTTAMAAYNQADIYKSVVTSKVIDDFKSVCFMDLGKLSGQKFGDINAAITYLEKAKTLTPEEPEVYLLLGTAYSMIKDYEKTIEYTKKSVELRPNDRDTKQNLAVAYQQYAYHDLSKKDLLLKAEKLLLEVYHEEKKLADNDVTKKEAILRTLDLLYRNYTIQGNISKQNEFKSEIEKYNPNAFTNQ